MTFEELNPNANCIPLSRLIYPPHNAKRRNKTRSIDLLNVSQRVTIDKADTPTKTEVIALWKDYQIR